MSQQLQRRRRVMSLSRRLDEPATWVAALVLSVALVMCAFWFVQDRPPGAISTVDGAVDAMLGPELLTHPGGVALGGKFMVGASPQGAERSVCSMGWPVLAGSQSGFLTAKHCVAIEHGPRGLMVDIPADHDQIQRIYAKPWLGTGDMAFIPVQSAPSLAGTFLMGRPIAEHPAALEWLVREKPRICRMGQTTGIACGEFRGVSQGQVYFVSNSNHGDSGGPVFALTESLAVPIGVVSGLEGSVTIAEPVRPYVDNWDLVFQVSRN